MNQAVLWLSQQADAALSSPWALPAYILLRIAAWRWLPVDMVTLILSDFANLVLLLLAVSQSRSNRLLSRKVDALAAVNPDIDEAAIEAECR